MLQGLLEHSEQFLAISQFNEEGEDNLQVVSAFNGRKIGTTRGKIFLYNKPIKKYI